MARVHQKITIQKDRYWQISQVFQGQIFRFLFEKYHALIWIRKSLNKVHPSSKWKTLMATSHVFIYSLSTTHLKTSLGNFTEPSWCHVRNGAFLKTMLWCCFCHVTYVILHSSCSCRNTKKVNLKEGKKRLEKKELNYNWTQIWRNQKVIDQSENGKRTKFQKTSEP